MADENKEEVSTEPVQPETTEAATIPAKPGLRTKIARLAHAGVATKKRKVLTAGIVVLVAAIILTLPVTRYGALGWIVKKDVTVTVRDTETGKPVSGANVALGKVSASTDKDGRAVIKKVPAGEYGLAITKKYYKTFSARYTVGLFTKPEAADERLVALGRQVAFKVNDKISGQPVDEAKLTVNGSSAITDKNGEAVIVLPPNSATQKGVLVKSGYNDAAATVTITADEATNTFTVTPAGSLVYLSNASGTIDVMRANLDGSGAKVIVAGTGKENRYDTSLLSARDWKYSALKSTRDGTTQELNLVTTASGEIKNIDEGSVTFNPVGWSGHKFIYTVNRNVPNWSDNASALKIYDADSGKLTTLDQTSGSGSNYYDELYQFFSPVYIIDNEIVYAKEWVIGQNFYWYGSQDPGKSTSLYSIDTATLKKWTIKDFPQHQSYGGLSLSLYEPQGIYVINSDNGSVEYDEYEDGTLRTIDQPNNNGQYPTYLVSPSGNKTFWYDLRDGKNTIFIGDKEGKNAQQIATLSDYVPYGWYGENDGYILFTKNGSELYIAPASTISGNPMKVTNYYKVQTYPGYGYGYGGQ